MRLFHMILLIAAFSYGFSFESRLSDLPLNESIALELSCLENSTLLLSYGEHLNGKDTIEFNSTKPINESIQFYMPESVLPGKYIENVQLICINSTDGAEIYNESIEVDVNIRDDTMITLRTEYESYRVNESVYIIITAPYNSTLNLTITNLNSSREEKYSTRINREAGLFYIPKEAGSYNVSARVSNKTETISLSAMFTVVRPLSCIISSWNSGKVNDTIIFEGSSSGGYPPYTFRWEIGNSSLAGREVRATFGKPGEYTAVLHLTDTRLQTAECSKGISIDLRAYSIRIQLFDQERNTVNDANVTIDSRVFKTNRNGKTLVDGLFEGKYEIKIRKEGYIDYSGYVQVRNDSEISLNITEKTIEEEKHGVTVTAPGRNFSQNSSRIEFRYKTVGKYDECKLLYNNLDLLGYRVLLETEEPDGKFTADVENGDFKFVVYCLNSKVEDYSQEFQINVTGVITQQKEALEKEVEKKSEVVPEITDPVLDELNVLLSRLTSARSELAKADNDERMVSDILNYERLLDQYEGEVKSLVTQQENIGSLNVEQSFRKSKLGEIKGKKDELMKKMPVGLFIISRNSFQAEPSIGAINRSAKEFLEQKALDLSGRKFKKYVKELEKIQDRVQIFTQLFHVQIEYADGNRGDFSIVRRAITTENNLSMSAIVEYVPKTIAESASEFLFSEQVNVIKEDPVFAFEVTGDKTYHYYINSQKALSALKTISAVLVEEPGSGENSITGFATADSIIGSGYVFYVIVILSLIGANVFIYSRFYSKSDITKQISFIRDAIDMVRPMDKDKKCVFVFNKAYQAITKGQSHASLSLFSKALRCYNNASPDIQRELAQVIDVIYLELELIGMKNIISNVYSHLNKGEIDKADDLQLESERRFSILPEVYKSRIKNEYANMNAAVKVKQMTLGIVHEKEDYWERIKENNKKIEL